MELKQQYQNCAFIREIVKVRSQHTYRDLCEVHELLFQTYLITYVQGTQIQMYQDEAEDFLSKDFEVQEINLLIHHLGQ